MLFVCTCSLLSVLGPWLTMWDDIWVSCPIWVGNAPLKLFWFKNWGGEERGPNMSQYHGVC